MIAVPDPWPDVPLPIGPLRYRMVVEPAGDRIHVEVRLLYDWPRRDGLLSRELKVAPYRQIYLSSAYVSEPCWLFRLMGDTVEKRVERAKRRVSRWAEGVIARRTRFMAALERVG